jgi:hypothetical protein
MVLNSIKRYKTAMEQTNLIVTVVTVEILKVFHERICEPNTEDKSEGKRIIFSLSKSGISNNENLEVFSLIKYLL